MLNKKDFQKADRRISRRFGLPRFTPAFLPHVPTRTFIIQLGGLTEEQTVAILQAAVESGVPLGTR